ALWEAHFAIGPAAPHRGNGAAGQIWLARAVASWPEPPEALQELGVRLLVAERTGDAIPLLDAAARLRPDDAGYLADAGFAQLRAGHIHAARGPHALAGELDAHDPITQAYLQELARVETAGRPN